MTFHVENNSLAVRIDQLEKIVVASRLWPVPLAREDHLGLLDTGDAIVPVMRFGASQPLTTAVDGELMVAILQVRGGSVGLVVERPGRLLNHYELTEEPSPAPAEDLGACVGQNMCAGDERFLLLNTDKLWPRHHLTTLSHSDDEPHPG